LLLNNRYDVRATLSEPPESFNHDASTYINRTDYLSASEQQAELLAEEERYYSLYQNEVEEELYKGKHTFFLPNLML
jgi:Alternative splicing regulator